MTDWTEVRLLACFEQVGLYADVQGRLVTRQWDEYRCLICRAAVLDRIGESGGRFGHAHWHLAVEGDDGPLARHLRTPAPASPGGIGPVGDARGVDDASEGTAGN